MSGARSAVPDLFEMPASEYPALLLRHPLSPPAESRRYRRDWAEIREVCNAP